MKYDVGDEVSLKENYDLRQNGWTHNDSIRFGLRRVKILEILEGNRYRAEILFSEERVVVDGRDLQPITKIPCPKEGAYSLKQLDFQVDEFKKYLAEVNKSNQCKISISIDTNDSSIVSEIKIRK